MPSLFLIIPHNSHEMGALADVKCTVNVTKRLPTCEHTAIVPCHKDPATVSCSSICGGQLSCCSRSCRSKCCECQFATKAASADAPAATGRLARSQHKTHPCERLLYCQHLCGRPCSQDHGCNTACDQKCRQACSHRSCPKHCSKPCAPCMEPCDWSCRHISCPVLCGSVSPTIPSDWYGPITKIIATRFAPDFLVTKLVRLPCPAAILVHQVSTIPPYLDTVKCRS